MKNLNMIFAISMMTVSLQAGALTKGQAVYPALPAQNSYDRTSPDFKKPFELIDVSGGKATLYRRDSGAIQVPVEHVYESVTAVNDWATEGRVDDESGKTLKMYPIKKGTGLVVSRPNDPGHDTTEHVVKQAFRTSEGYAGFLFEDGKSFSAHSTGTFWVIEPKDAKNRELGGYFGSLKVGATVAIREDYFEWTRQSSGDNRFDSAKVPTTKITAIAVLVNRYDVIEEIYRTEKGEWLRYDQFMLAVGSAFGLKIGDTLSLENRFDLRIEQLFKWDRNEYSAITSNGGLVTLSNESVRRLAAHRVCSGKPNEGDQLCRNYAEHLEDLKNPDRARLSCRFHPQDAKADFQKRTLVIQGGKFGEGKVITNDMMEWDGTMKGVKTRVRIDRGMNGGMQTWSNGKLDINGGSGCEYE